MGAWITMLKGASKNGRNSGNCQNASAKWRRGEKECVCTELVSMLIRLSQAKAEYIPPEDGIIKVILLYIPPTRLGMR